MTKRRLRIGRHVRTLRVQEGAAASVRVVPPDGASVEGGAVTTATLGKDGHVWTSVGVVCGTASGRTVVVEVARGSEPDDTAATTAALGEASTAERLARALASIEARYDAGEHARLAHEEETATAEHARWLEARDREVDGIDAAIYEAYVAGENLPPQQASRLAEDAGRAAAQAAGAGSIGQTPLANSARRARLRVLDELVEHAVAVAVTGRETGCTLPRPSIGLRAGIDRAIRTWATERVAASLRLEELDRTIATALEATRPARYRELSNRPV